MSNPKVFSLQHYAPRGGAWAKDVGRTCVPPNPIHRVRCQGRLPPPAASLSLVDAPRSLGPHKASTGLRIPRPTVLSSTWV